MTNIIITTTISIKIILIIITTHLVQFNSASGSRCLSRSISSQVRSGRPVGEDDNDDGDDDDDLKMIKLQILVLLI
jgi:hypothetical protein